MRFRRAAYLACLSGCAAALYAFQTPQPSATAQKCTLEGRVVNAANGEPLSKASIMLVPADAPRPASGLPQVFGTTTDASGRFAMKDLDPGGYRLRTLRTGFVTSEYGARKLSGAGAILRLTEGRATKDIEVRLTPQGVIAGRVLDEDGEPIASAAVQLLKLQYTNGRKQLQATASVTTNDLGEYRAFGASPGKYYVTAGLQLSDAAAMLSIDRSAAPRPEENYVATYYPGTPDPTAAVPLEIAPGAQIRGIDLTLVKRRTATIKGRVTPPGALLIVAPRNLSGALSLKIVRLDPKGEFEIHGLAPGSYALTTSARVGNKSYTSSMPVEVGTNNIEGINFVVGAGVAVTGRVRIEGDSAADLSPVQVRTQPKQMGIGSVLAGLGSVFAGATPGEASGKLDSDLAFRLEDLSPDEYEVRLTGLPAGFYVKSIRSGETDVLADGLNVRGASPEPLDIVVSPKAAQIAGAAEIPGAGQPSPEAVVVLVPQEKGRQGSAVYYRQTTADASGRFTFKDVPPGSYKVFAWDDVESGAWMDPEFLKPLESKGEPVSVSEGANETVKLKVIAAEEAPAKSAR